MNSDKKALTEKKIIAVLLIIFVAGFMYNIKRVSTQEAVFGGRLEIINSSIEKERLPDFIRKDIVYQGEPFRDPLKKPLELVMLEGQGVSPAGIGSAIKELGPKKGEFTLQGIIWGGAENLAIVSGQVVSEGEMVGSAKIVSIREDRVVIMKNGKEIELVR